MPYLPYESVISLGNIPISQCLVQYLSERTGLINTEGTKFNKLREPLIWVSNTKWPWLFCFKIFSSSVKNAPVNLL